MYKDASSNKFGQQKLFILWFLFFFALIKYFTILSSQIAILGLQ